MYLLAQPSLSISDIGFPIFLYIAFIFPKIAQTSLSTDKGRIACLKILICSKLYSFLCEFSAPNINYPNVHPYILWHYF